MPLVILPCRRLWGTREPQHSANTAPTERQQSPESVFMWREQGRSADRAPTVPTEPNRAPTDRKQSANRAPTEPSPNRAPTERQHSANTAPTEPQQSANRAGKAYSCGANKAGAPTERQQSPNKAPTEPETRIHVARARPDQESGKSANRAQNERKQSPNRAPTEPSHNRAPTEPQQSANRAGKRIHVALITKPDQELGQSPNKAPTKSQQSANRAGKAYSCGASKSGPGARPERRQSANRAQMAPTDRKQSPNKAPREPQQSANRAPTERRQSRKNVFMWREQSRTRPTPRVPTERQHSANRKKRSEERERCSTPGPPKAT